MGTEAEEKELAAAREHLGYWQRELRLDHIDFEIILMAPEDNNGNLGDCKHSFGRHRQKIRLYNPADRTDKDRAVFRRDLEVVIVHELLHTKEMPWRDHPKVDEIFDKDKWLEGLHEDSLDAVAEALVRARRGMRR
jgi:hypothetical protein